MQQQTRVRLYDVHSWTGAFLGLFVFALCFTGTVALFFNELEPWERPAARGAMPDRPALDAAVAAVAAAHGDAFPDDFLVFAPEPYRNSILIGFQPTTPGAERITIEADPSSGAIIGPYHEGVGRFLRNLHTDLHLPSPWGRYLVGLGGIVMLLSIVTGIATHAKIIKNLHVFRPDRSRRLAWTDAHNVSGVWALPFHLMIAFTGTIIGLAGLFLIPLALATTGGDQDAAIAAIVGDPPQAAGTPAVMASLNEVLHDAAMRMPEARASLVDVHYWGDANATAHVRIEDGPDLKHVTELRYSLSSGAFREAWALSETSGGRVYAAMTPLHYGTFGGIALKALYAVLGLASSFVVASGMVVWLERRAQRGTGVSQRVSGVWVGASTGMLLATAGALALHHALPSSTDRVFGTGLTYAGLWVLAVGYAAWRAEDRTALRHLLAATAVLLAMTPLIRLSVEGAELWSSSLPAVATDMTLIAVAIATAILTQAIPVPSTHEKSPRAVSPQRVPLTRSGVE